MPSSIGMGASHSMVMPSRVSVWCWLMRCSRAGRAGAHPSAAARMERSEMREGSEMREAPDFAALHPGYRLASGLRATRCRCNTPMPQRPSGAGGRGVRFGKISGRTRMRHLRVASMVVAALAATGASAPAADDNLNDTQKLGRSLFVQSCGVCHLKPQLTAVQFAPVLSKESLGG